MQMFDIFLTRRRQDVRTHFGEHTLLYQLVRYQFRWAVLTLPIIAVYGS